MNIIRKRTALLAVLLFISSLAGFADTVEAVPVLISAGPELISASVGTEVQMREMDGVMMVPLRTVAEALGFKVEWDAEAQAAEVSRDALWTRVTPEKNAYFFGRRAPEPLSHAPLAVDGRIWVPVEFFSVILQTAVEVQGETAVFWANEDIAIHHGVIRSVDITSQRVVQIGISYSETDETVDLILNTSSEHTVFQRRASLGESITVVSPPIMALSYLGQTAAILVY